MTKQRYNGWTNYETWVVKLWIDNEEGSQQFWTEQAEQAILTAARVPVEATEFTTAERAALTLSAILKDYHDGALPELTGFAADLLGAAMSEVNWHEIARSLVEDAMQESEVVK